MEKAIAVPAMDMAKQLLSAANSANTPKCTHLAADPARKGVNHHRLSQLCRKLKEEIEDHQATMALASPFEKAGKL